MWSVHRKLNKLGIVMLETFCTVYARSRGTKEHVIAPLLELRKTLAVSHGWQIEFIWRKNTV